MRTILTHDLTPELAERMDPETKHWVYNALDVCVTAEVFEAIEPQLDPTTRATYEFSKSLQGPVLEMKLRGVLVDQHQRAKVLRQFEETVDVLRHNLNRIVCLGVGYRTIPADPNRPRNTPKHQEFNWASPHQIKELFYGVMRLPEQKKKGALTVERDALERLLGYFHAQPIIHHLLALRDLGKKIGVLRTAVDDDGRMRTSYNIAGTETGRFSSNVSDFGTGTNLQNIEDSLRSILVSDPGMKFAYIDLEQAESRLVGALCHNLGFGHAYLDACESGDLHTTVTRMARPGLAWTGDPTADREIADGPGYRHMSMRDLSKRLGHGSNYGGLPQTMAKHTHLPVPVVREFQEGYFNGFPEIPMWHEHVKRTLLDAGFITSLSGRKRWFFGRRNEASTQREAIAFDPQGSVGDVLNRGMLQVWQANCCQLLLQVHDAILVQYPAHIESTLIPRLQKLITVEVPLRDGRILAIPSDAAVGWNFGKNVPAYVDKKTGELIPEKNPDGLKKFKGRDTRRRQRKAAGSSLDFLLG